MTTPNNDSYKYQRLPFFNLSGDPKNEKNDPLGDLCNQEWTYKKNGDPIAVTSCYPESIYQSYLDTIDEINDLSKDVDQDTKDSPLGEELRIWKIKKQILRRWIRLYHKQVKRLKLPALIPEIETQSAQSDTNEIKNL